MQVVCDPAGRVAQTVPDLACSLLVYTHSIKHFSRAGIATCVSDCGGFVLAALRHVMESGLGPRRPTAGLGEEEKGSHAECSSAKWHCLCCGAEMNSNGWWQCIRMPKYLVIISCEE